MAKRGYQTQEQVSASLDRLLASMRRRGEALLPSERALAEKLSCSRETVRRTIEALEADGVVVRRGRSRMLVSDTIAEERSDFSFVALGANAITYPAWNKLWHLLERAARPWGIRGRLVLVSATTEQLEPSFLDQLDDVVIVTSIGNATVREQLLTLPGRTVITTDGHYVDDCENSVTFDRREAGRLAALMLAESGYRRPAMISSRQAPDGWMFRPFREAVEGYRSACEQCGLPAGDDSLFWIEGGSGLSTLVQLESLVERILAEGFDGLFYYADNAIDTVYELLTRHRSIPDDFGLVTVNSVDKAIEHVPPVSAVSATEVLARPLAERLSDILTGRRAPPVRLLIKPYPYPGATLRTADSR